MREKYEKPQFVIEHFGMTQTVASCNFDYSAENSLGVPNHYNKESCGWALGDIVVFTEANTGCEIQTNDDFGAVCYNTPAGNVTIFAS
ncbi:MAG: hypothetical protein Q4B85_08505 [Lachnospiraceae bacterium]|nr:hypothetical protein [Lachnospiraceae bacterium]